MSRPFAIASASSLLALTCSSTTTHVSITMRRDGNEVTAPTLLVLPGTPLTLSGATETTDQGVFPVSSNSEHVEYAHADLAISCKSRTKAWCEVHGNTVTPQRPGTFEVTARAGEHTRSWTITALDVKRIELEPCGTVTAASGERDVGVYAVGAEGRIKLAMPAVIDGTPATRVAISQPATFELRATVAGVTGACRLSVIAAP